MEKTDYIHIRTTQPLKEQIALLAELKGKTPSQYIRGVLSDQYQEHMESLA